MFAGLSEPEGGAACHTVVVAQGCAAQPKERDEVMGAMRVRGGGAWAAAVVAGMAMGLNALGATVTLPVKGVTLYRSGVAYVERAGPVRGDVEVSLRFETSQVNDILKSLVAIDAGGGAVRAVRYGSKDPLQRRLSSFGIDISDNPSMLEMLGRLRGAKVRLGSVDGPIEGTVLGTEQRQVGTAGGAGSAPQALWEGFANVLTSAGVRSVSVQRMTSFEVLDPKLAEELQLALAALAESRDERSSTVDVAFGGDGERRVAIGYVVESPVWKTSYRLVLPEETGGKPTIQGWAIVENTTDEDWTDVRLALASGSPVGFTMDLHEPLYVQRPEIPVPAAGLAVSRAYEGEIPMFTVTTAVERHEAAGDRAAGGRERATAALAYSAPGAAGTLKAGIAEAMVGAATASTVGEQFHYEVREPVTIERQRSAMLPMVSAPVEGRRVSIYALADGGKHPMRGVEFTNGSGFDLPAGPVAVYDGAAYGGDAQISFTSRGTDRLLSYATDLDVEVSVDSRSARETRGLRIVDGMVEETARLRKETEYTLVSRDGSRGRTVILEQPKESGWDVVAPREGVKETDSGLRIETALKENESKKVVLGLERTTLSRVSVSTFDVGTMLQFQQSGKASAAVLEAVRMAALKQARINEAERGIARTQGELGAMQGDQSRIRENIKAVGKEAELYARYVQKLGEQESQIERLNEQLKALAAEREAAVRDLNEFVRNLNVA